MSMELVDVIDKLRISRVQSTLVRPSFEWCKSTTDEKGENLFDVARFAYLERVDNATWGCRVSLTAKHTSNMLSVLNVSPQFLPSLLGKPDYASPGDFLTHDQIGNVQQHGTIHFPALSR